MLSCCRHQEPFKQQTSYCLHHHCFSSPLLCSNLLIHLSYLSLLLKEMSYFLCFFSSSTAVQIFGYIQTYICHDQFFCVTAFLAESSSEKQPSEKPSTARVEMLSCARGTFIPPKAIPVLLIYPGELQQLRSEGLEMQNVCSSFKCAGRWAAGLLALTGRLKMVITF